MNNYFITLLLLISFSCNSQKKSQQQVLESKVENKDFKLFLSSFYTVEFPLNYTKETEKIIDKTVSIKRLTKNEALNYLKIPSKNLQYADIKYDYDTDKKVVKSVENPPYAHFKHFTKDYVIVCFRHSNGPEGDSLFVYLNTFDFKGNLIDKALVGGQFTRESDWYSFFINESTIKVYNYGINQENFIVKNNTFKVKDKEKPLSVVSIETFEISNKGMINKVQTGDKTYLKFDLDTYKRFHSNTDDPINSN